MTDSEALLARAGRLTAAGDAAGAFGFYREAARLHPTCAPAWLGMSGLLVRGDEGGATQVLSHGMAAMAADAEGRAQLAGPFADRMGKLRPTGWHAPIERDLRILFGEAIDHQRLAHVAALTLLGKAETDGEGDTALDRIAEDPLWSVFLARCLNVEPAMETRLRAIRAAVAGRAGPLTEARARLVCALALQAFAGEYVLEPVAAPRAGDDVDAVLLTCLDRPLIDLAPSEATLRAIEARGGHLGVLLVRRTLTDLQREAGLADSVPTFGASPGPEDTVSAKVRAQYEANPYPRWTAPPTPTPAALTDHISALPGVDAARLPVGPLKVLIAGCGTGFEAIDLARMDPTLEITALDLSRRSLAYGLRMAEDLGVGTIAFRQGDILDLADAPATFDVATSTGVLHHMDDPVAGLRAIGQALRPGGVVRIALYSERARGPVIAAHRRIREQGLTATPEGVRAFRAQVLAAPSVSPLAALKTSDDLYSLSGCRDLVFHVHERRFTPPQVADLVGAAGMTMVGFDAPPEALAAFRGAFGPEADALDMDCWDVLEAREPFLFAGMYAVWCQVK